MKSIKIIGLVLAALLVVVSASWAARAPKSAVKNSPHDFMTGINGGGEWTAPSYALCSFCHIAHKFGAGAASADVPGYLLWNHTLSSATYTVYTSPSMVNPAEPLDGQMTTSNLCLSCHDGTVAINSFYEDISLADYSGTIGGQTAAFMPGAATIDPQAQGKQHPINFLYPAPTDAANIGMRPAADNFSIDGNGTVPLYDGKMQCSTCHDPHAGPTVSHLFFRAFPSTPEQTATGSFCTYCHL